MSQQSLESVLHTARQPGALLRNSQIGPYAFPVVRSEFTNWRDEQRAWRETCALFDQSHHMTDLYLEGPDALRLLSDLGVNSFKKFKVNQAKQFVACNPDGYVIGDAILFYLGENQLQPGRPSAGLELGAVPRRDRQATTSRPSATSDRRSIRAGARVPVPGAGAERAARSWRRSPARRCRTSGSSTWTSSPSPAIDVRALRHGMVGQPGWEIFGPWEQGDAVATPSSRPARSSASGRSARAPIRPAASSPDGFRRRCRRSIPARR